MSKASFKNLSEIPWLKVFNQTIDQPQTLPALLAEYGVDAFHLAKLAKKSPNSNEAYGRKVLFKNQEIEVMVAEWSYKAMAAPHNHGTSQGLIWFARGDFYEQHYRFQNRDLVEIEKPQFFKENQTAAVGSSDIHSCSPATTGLSLHIYSPPIHKMKVWDQKSKRTLTVADECGAWVPDDPAFILAESVW